MGEKMLVTQALDERDLLVKKIAAISRLAGGNPHGCNVGIFYK